MWGGGGGADLLHWQLGEEGEGEGGVNGMLISACLSCLSPSPLTG